MCKTATQCKVVVSFFLICGGLLFAAIPLLSGYMFSGSGIFDTAVHAQQAVPEKSNLIINCGFGESKKTDEYGNIIQDCGIEHLFVLANNVVKVLLWLAITGAGILIFWKGAKLATHLFWGGYSAAREDLQKALKAILIGLLLILSAYLIVKAGFTIIGYKGNPFVSDIPTTRQVKPPPPTKPTAPSEPTTLTAQTADSAPDGCTTDCKKLTGSGVTHKESGRSGNRGCDNDPGKSCWVSANLLDKLKSLNEEPSVNWWVTESCPPTTTHIHSCHRTQYCDCVDINFFAGSSSDHSPSRTNVEDFLKKMGELGLYAVYEIPNEKIDTENNYSTLRSNIPEKIVGTHGKIIHIRVKYPHFSVYESAAVYNNRR